MLAGSPHSVPGGLSRLPSLIVGQGGKYLNPPAEGVQAPSPWIAFAGLVILNYHMFISLEYLVIFRFWHLKDFPSSEHARGDVTLPVEAICLVKEASGRHRVFIYSTAALAAREHFWLRTHKQELS